MSDFNAEDKGGQRAATPAGGASQSGGGASPETALHQTRMNVTRHRRAAMRKGEGKAGAPQVDIPEGDGQGLPGGVKNSMEKKLGADLSGVKIHTGGDSAGASEKLNARAFTVGSDVHFNAGQFDPGSKEGTKLLAHELTHVVQGQKGGVQKKEEESGEADAEGKDGEALEVSDPEEPAEQEADAVADKATEDMPEGGAEADGKEGGDDESASNDVAGPEAKKDDEESEGPAEATEEKAPEAGAKLQAPISAKYSASALRKILRKKAYRDDAPPAEATGPEAEGDEKKEAAPEDEGAEAAGEAKPEASPEGAGAESEAKPEADTAPPAEEPQDEGKKVAAKLRGIHRKVFRAAGGPPPAADPDVDAGTIKNELAAGAGAGGNNYTAAEAEGLATQIAAGGTMKRSALDAAKVGCEQRLITAWKATAVDHAEFAKGFASPDPIALRKFGELDGEPDSNYEGGAGGASKSLFYAKLAGDILAAPPRRTNVFSKCDAAVRSAGLRMKGTLIPEAALAPTLHRTAGIENTWRFSTNQDAVAGDFMTDNAATLPASLRGIPNADMLTRYPKMIRTYWLEKGGAYAHGKLKGNLTPPGGGTWFSSGQVNVMPGDAGFEQLMDVGALQPEWFAEGAAKFTIASAGLGTIKENLRKPTCLDGMQSGMFVPRPDGVFGVTGGGYNEFLAGAVPVANVTNMELIETSPGLRAEIEAADAQAKADGHGSTMDAMERGATPNLGGAQGTYDRVGGRTAQERTTPTSAADSMRNHDRGNRV